jgi:hypothetical protein
MVVNFYISVVFENAILCFYENSDEEMKLEFT